MALIEADISVVMPARNAADTIVESLCSVLDQDRLLEVIVVNDGSTDQTAAKVEALNDPRIRMIKGPQSGISNALNAGFEAAQGRYIARCDSDDLYAPGRLAEQAAFLDAHEAFCAVSGGFATIDAQGRVLAKLVCDGDAREHTDLLRAGRVQTHLCTWLTRTETLTESKGARAWFETAEDVDLQFRLACLGRVWHIPQIAYQYRLHGQSITHQRKRERLAFFDKTARTFLADRVQTGSDALDRGIPPEIPDFSGVSDHGGQSIEMQMRGHLIRQAWRDVEAGARVEGLQRMWRAVCLAPGKLDSWRGLVTLLVKAARRRS